MRYACKIIKGEHVAVVENERGDVLAISPPCDSKFQAMGARDRARNENATMPSGWAPPAGAPAMEPPVEPEPAPVVTPHPLDHDGDGRKGGSLPKKKRKPKADPVPDSKE